MEVYQIRTVETLAEMVEKFPVVVLDFYADWCGPCKKAMPQYQRLPQEFGGKVLFAKVNVDHADERITTGFQAESIPLFVIIHNQKTVHRLSGFHQGTIPEIQRLVTDLLPRETTQVQQMPNGCVRTQRSREEDDVTTNEEVIDCRRKR